jgi:hypothetical protein
MSGRRASCKKTRAFASANAPQKGYQIRQADLLPQDADGIGLVKMKSFASCKNKFGYVYLLAPTSIVQNVAITHLFLKRKIDGCKALRPELEALKVELDEDQAAGLRMQAQ